MSLKSKLYNIVIDDKTVGGRRFDIFIMILIVISLITFPLETLRVDNDLFFQVLNFFKSSIFSSLQKPKKRVFIFFSEPPPKKNIKSRNLLSAGKNYS